jgi:hypothetical protein
MVKGIRPRLLRDEAKRNLCDTKSSQVVDPCIASRLYTTVFLAQGTRGPCLGTLGGCACPAREGLASHHRVYYRCAVTSRTPKKEFQCISCPLGFISLLFVITHTLYYLTSTWLHHLDSHILHKQIYNNWWKSRVILNELPF